MEKEVGEWFGSPHRSAPCLRFAPRSLRRTWSLVDPQGAKAVNGNRHPEDEDALRARLGEEACRVTKDCGTEPSFRNACWDRLAQLLEADRG